MWESVVCSVSIEGGDLFEEKILGNIGIWM